MSHFPPSGASILNLTPEAARQSIMEWVTAKQLPSYRTAQIMRRLWQLPAADWNAATELPLSLRGELTQAWPLERLELSLVQRSSDGTQKYLWRLTDRELIESVLIPSGSRRTLCISSQAGCALKCQFCATGTMGFRRQLSPFEIAGQIREVLLLEGLEPGITNVVFMGMGEPLLNWSSVDTALTILNSPLGLGIGARHITVSTVGIIPGMLQLAARPEQFRLAISLHSPDSVKRLALMPIEKRYPLAEVIAAAKRFRKRVTLEYVVISGKNDSDEDIRLLAAIARDLGAMINLLPLHPGGAAGLLPSSKRRIHTFAARLTELGVEAVVRRSRGLDIDAACGQLRAKVGSDSIPTAPVTE